MTQQLTGIALRNALVARAKALGLDTNGTSIDLQVRIADAIAAKANRAALSDTSTQGGHDEPADDPGPDGSGEAGTPPDVARETVLRSNAHSWWCPRCDNSQPNKLTECQKCGWERPGA